MAVQLRGYSERGMINSLFYEIRYAEQGLELLRDLLGLGAFPNAETAPDLRNVTLATIRIEQSFSDFGDLDVLVLLDGNPRQSILIEAKVKTFQSRQWKIADEWSRFKATLALPEVDPDVRRQQKKSNLFIQLYRKLRLLKQVQNANATLEADSVAWRWSLGQNGVVERASRELGEYCGPGSKAWLLALVPDTHEHLAHFFSTTLRDFRATDLHVTLPDWNSQPMGYLAWESIESHCRENPAQWPDTLANFSDNQGQVY